MSVRLLVTAALLGAASAQVPYELASPRCHDAFWPDGASVSSFPSAGALLSFYQSNADAHAAFSGNVTAGTPVDVSALAGSAALDAACADAGGHTFPTAVTVDGATLSTLICVADDCVNAYDWAYLEVLWKVIACLPYEGHQCHWAPDLTSFWDPWGPWTLLGIIAAVFAGVLLPAAAAYFPGDDGNGLSLRNTLLNPDMESGGGSREPGADKKTDDDDAPKTWLSIAAAAWDPRRNFASLVAPSKFAPLDGLRAWAVLWVLGIHSTIFWEYWTKPVVDGEVVSLADLPGDKQFQDLLLSDVMQPIIHGDFGVDIFFALSGFLIAHLLAREYDREGGIRAGRFLLRRWLRIAPIMFTALGLQQALPSWRDNLYVGGGCDSSVNWRFLLFIQNETAESRACVGQLWSVAVEFQMYVLSVPIMLVALLNWEERRWLRHPNRWALPLAAVVLASLATRMVYLVNGTSTWDNPQLDYNVVYFNTHTRISGYIAGMAGALMLRASRADSSLEDWTGAKKYAAHTLAAFVWVFMSYYGESWVFGKHHTPALIVDVLIQVAGRAAFAASVSYFIVMMLSGHARALNWLLSWPLWRPIARLSYGAYTVQFTGMTFIAYYMWLDGAPSVFSSFLVYLCYLAASTLWCFAIAFVMYMVVERPMMSLRSQLGL